MTNQKQSDMELITAGLEPALLFILSCANIGIFILGAESSMLDTVLIHLLVGVFFFWATWDTVTHDTSPLGNVAEMLMTDRGN
jgi:hypothetical protein